MKELGLLRPQRVGEVETSLDIEQFSTLGQRPVDRLPFWNDITLKLIGPIAIDTSAPDQFKAKMTRIRTRDCDLYSTISPAATIQHKANQDDPDVLCLLVMQAGQVWNMCGDDTALLTPGDFMLYDPSRPLKVHFSEPVESVVVRLPRAQSEARLPTLRRMTGVKMSGNTGANAVLSSFIRTAWDNLKSGEDGNQWADSLSNVLWPMLEMVYALRPGTLGGATRSDRLRRDVLEFVDRNLNNSDLSVHAIAQEFGISTRYVQMLFTDMAMTPSSYVEGRRLELAARRLGRPSDDASITEIAFNAGFNDLSSFSRAFKRRFAVTPRDFRAGRRSRPS